MNYLFIDYDAKLPRGPLSEIIEIDAMLTDENLKRINITQILISPSLVYSRELRDYIICTEKPNSFKEYYGKIKRILEVEDTIIICADIEEFQYQLNLNCDAFELEHINFKGYEMYDLIERLEQDQKVRNISRFFRDTDLDVGNVNEDYEYLNAGLLKNKKRLAEKCKEENISLQEMIVRENPEVYDSKNTYNLRQKAEKQLLDITIKNRENAYKIYKSLLDKAPNDKLPNLFISKFISGKPNLMQEIANSELLDNYNIVMKVEESDIILVKTKDQFKQSQFVYESKCPDEFITLKEFTKRINKGSC